MSKKLFKEKQQFNGWEIIALVTLLMVGVAYKLISELVQPSESFWLTLGLSIGILSLLGGILKYLLNLRLNIKVNKKHISFSMPPYQSGKEKIKWKDVAVCEVVKTPLLAQWHGGNINFNHEKRYSFNGRNGVHIATKNGEKYFIGSKKPDALLEAIQKAIGLPL